ncbi:MAG TPA: hypothetical protein DCX32_03275 [Candidatus Moranbacteria bacterium]|nr:MAG: hypothetical protein UW87_C0015G0012 [Candidatus Moranbacteria bacterium GW2011_GWC2_45_10]KKT92695.1 MAG: hypothetical protein UW95_C0030G0010 [Parcubacteria group bacterium GW2011_GWC1_45_14]HAV11540.1 hypothetical protein [Candidatus Moranbacteria bacterium]
MKKINDWLVQFATAWKTHDIDNVLNLFTDDVEYWETPFDKLSSLDELKSEWESIKNQKNIEVLWEVFSKDEDKYAVKWSLEYTDKNYIEKLFKGVYLIKLNPDNKCDYFFHCEESKT